MQHNAVFFGIVATISCCTLIPTYQIGKTNKEKLTSPTDQLTLLNALGHPEKMWVVFIITFVIGIIGHVSIYLYE